jgi:hypothetical protein
MTRKPSQSRLLFYFAMLLGCVAMVVLLLGAIIAAKLLLIFGCRSTLMPSSQQHGTIQLRNLISCCCCPPCYLHILPVSFRIS